MIEESRKLVKRILDEAEQEATNIIQQSKGEAERIINEKINDARLRAEKETKTEIEKATADAAAQFDRIVSDSKRRINWMILEERKKLIDKVFDQLKNKLTTFTDTKDYDYLLIKLLNNVVEKVDSDKLIISFNEKDLNKKIPSSITIKSGKIIRLEKSPQPLETLGGAIFQSGDGKITINQTFEEIIAQERKNLEPKIASILFSKETW